MDWRWRFGPSVRLVRAGVAGPAQIGDWSSRLVDKTWRLAEAAPQHLLDEAKEDGIAPLVAQVLYNRGFASVEAMLDFLAADCAPGHPLLLRDMGKAVALLREALARGALIAVYGDYDADGLTAAVLLVETIAFLGGRAEPYIPHRSVEGYGLNRAALKRLREQGAEVVITVDCGIGSVDEVSYAHELGLAVIVTDHHEVHGPLPVADAVVNPKRLGNGYQFRELAGVGVAFRLAEALVSSMAPARWPELEAALLDLVAIGTVADVVPLLGENRTLVKRGLSALNSTRRPGLLEMAVLAGLPLGALDEGHVGYGLAPRLNAAGRVADARQAYQLQAYQLLVEKSRDEARRLALALERHNLERQRLTERGVNVARDLAQRQLPAPLLLVAHEEFLIGVAGLIAAKLVEEHGRPAVVLERGAEMCRGSARSVNGFDVGRAIAGCADLLQRYGGHPMAAGLAVATDRLEALHLRLVAAAVEEMAGRDLRPELTIDAELDLAEVDWDLHRDLGQLPPYGLGNAEPLFASRAYVRECRSVGKTGAHLRLRLESGAAEVTAVGFGLGGLAKFRPGDLVEVAYTLAVNEWNGERRLELRLKDVRRGETHRGSGRN